VHQLPLQVAVRPIQHLKLEMLAADPTRTSELIKIAQFSLRQNFTVTFVRSPESDGSAAGTSLSFSRWAAFDTRKSK
jgi:hypothetical protein